MVDVRAGSWASVTKVGHRVLGALDAAKIKVVLVTQASSEHSISVAIDESSGEAAVGALRAAFELELARGEISSVKAHKGFSMFTVVGPMRAVKGTLKKLIDGVTKSGANISAVAQGSSEQSISVILSEDDLVPAMVVVHAEFLDGRGGV